MSASISEHFSPLQDPRVKRNKLHALPDIILLPVCAVVSGADGWEAIEEFGREKQEWLRQFAPFKNEVPSHDGIAIVLSRLSPQGFQESFGSWTRAVATATVREVVAVDGKTARGSHDRRGARRPPRPAPRHTNRRPCSSLVCSLPCRSSAPAAAPTGASSPSLPKRPRSSARHNTHLAILLKVNTYLIRVRS